MRVCVQHGVGRAVGIWDDNGIVLRHVGNPEELKDNWSADRDASFEQDLMQARLGVRSGRRGCGQK